MAVERECRRCGGTFESSPTFRFYCSEVCRVEARAEKMLGYQADYREGHREQISEAAKRRWDANRVGPPRRVGPDPEKKRDPEVNRQRARAWYWANPERAKARVKRRREQNPEMHNEENRRRDALKKGATIGKVTPETIAAKVAYWGNKCWVCGGSYEALDHVKPLAKGGPHMVANLRPICIPCNSRKSARWSGVAGLTRVMHARGHADNDVATRGTTAA